MTINTCFATPLSLTPTSYHDTINTKSTTTTLRPPPAHSRCAKRRMPSITMMNNGNKDPNRFRTPQLSTTRHINMTKNMNLQPRMAGMPKVPYKAPGAQNHEFIDIFNRLYRERIIYVGQDLDDEQANQIIAVMLYLENDDANANVSFYFNCPGGTISAGLAVYDCMRAMRYPIVTINLGLAASMCAFLVGAGSKGKRMALPNARFLLQAPALNDAVRGQASDIEIEVNNVLRQRDRIVDGLHEMTGRGKDEITKDLSRDMYLTAPEARNYGLIDQVLLPSVKGPTTSFVDGLGTSGIGLQRS